VGFVTAEPIELAPLIAAVQAPERGGVASFLGLVRNHHGGRAVLRLEYSAYAPMAEAECARIVAEAEGRWQVSVALRHRVGSLAVGDVAVAAAPASAPSEAAVAARPDL
jgi:molybdopterin synthase catalytic subunit